MDGSAEGRKKERRIREASQKPDGRTRQVAQLGPLR
jgi:hypothetical protein